MVIKLGKFPKQAMVVQSPTPVTKQDADANQNDDLPDRPTVGRREIAEKMHFMIKEMGKALPLSLAEDVAVAYEKAVIQLTEEGNDVVLPGFGSFYGKKRKGRQCYLPLATGGKQQKWVPACYTPTFKFGLTLKRAIKDGKKA